MAAPGRQASGFTLIESMAVIAITAILLAIGMPQLNEFSASRTMTSHVSLLAGAMRLARAEAVKRGTRVTICPSLSPEAAAPACDGGDDDWAEGWVIFTDLGTINSIDAGDRLIRVQPPLRDSAGIQSVGGGAVNFFPTGIAIGGERTFNFLPRLATTHPNYSLAARRMCVDNSGGTRLRDYSVTC